MQLAKLLIITGGVLLALGLLLWGLASIGIGQKLGKLPGDIHFEGKNFKLYFPIATSLLFSFLLSLILYLIGKWRS